MRALARFLVSLHFGCDIRVCRGFLALGFHFRDGFRASFWGRFHGLHGVIFVATPLGLNFGGLLRFAMSSSLSGFMFGTAIRLHPGGVCKVCTASSLQGFIFRAALRLILGATVEFAGFDFETASGLHLGGYWL